MGGDSVEVGWQRCHSLLCAPAFLVACACVCLAAVYVVTVSVVSRSGAVYPLKPPHTIHFSPPPSSDKYKDTSNSTNSRGDDINEKPSQDSVEERHACTPEKGQQEEKGRKPVETTAFVSQYREEEHAEAVKRVLSQGRKPMLMAGDMRDLVELWFGGVVNYVEFGAGGSTLMVCRAVAEGATVENVVVVEGSASFLSETFQNLYQEHAALYPNHDYPNLHSIVPFYGPLKDFSQPTAAAQPTIRKTFPQYPSSGKLIPFLPDLVFVDGRFRAACVLHSILQWGTHPVIIVDDFADREKVYWPPISKWVDIISWPRGKDRRFLIARGKSLDAEQQEELQQAYEAQASDPS